MSHTLNNITMLVALSDVTKDSAKMQSYILANAEHIKEEGRSFKEYPELFTESLVSEQLNVLRKSGLGENIGRKIHGTAIHEDLEHAGIDPGLMSRTEYREMQIAKLFFNEFKPDASFKEVLWNARDNINAHLMSSQDHEGLTNSGRHIPPSILYSTCLGNEGRGVGVGEPDVYQLSDAMSKNENIQALFDKLIDANSLYYESQGLGDKIKDGWARLSERVRDASEDALLNPAQAMLKGAGALGLAILINYSAPGLDAPKMETLSYAPNADSYSVMVQIKDNDTVDDIMKKALIAIDVKPNEDNIASMRGINRMDDGVQRGTLISIKLPEINLTSEQKDKLSDMGTVSKNGAPLMPTASNSKFLDNLEEKRGNEHSGMSM